MPWEQPPENSLDALLHGMQVSDGVEFDLRLSVEGELVVYHDTRTADGRYPECEKASSMPDYVCTLDELLAESEFVEPWVNEGKFACIELKIPHPTESRMWHSIEVIEMLRDYYRPHNNQLADLFDGKRYEQWDY